MVHEHYSTQKIMTTQIGGDAPTDTSLQSNHQDYIQDISFDHYGRRIATTSADRTIQIWDLNPDGTFAVGGGQFMQNVSLAIFGNNSYSKDNDKNIFCWNDTIIITVVLGSNSMRVS